MFATLRSTPRLFARTVSTKQGPRISDNVTINFRIPPKLKSYAQQYVRSFKWMVEYVPRDPVNPVPIPDFYNKGSRFVTVSGLLGGGFLGGLYHYDSCKSYHRKFSVNLGGLAMTSVVGAGIGGILGVVAGSVWPITAPIICVVGPLSFINVPCG